MKHYLNAMIPIFKHSQDRLCDIFGELDEIQVYEWSFQDTAKCKGPVLQKDINGELVKYDKVRKEAFVWDLSLHTVDAICGIYNTLKWGL